MENPGSHILQKGMGSPPCSSYWSKTALNQANSTDSSVERLFFKPKEKLRVFQLKCSLKGIYCPLINN